jgi:hypothetical protein
MATDLLNNIDINIINICVSRERMIKKCFFYTDFVEWEMQTFTSSSRSFQFRDLLSSLC